MFDDYEVQLPERLDQLAFRLYGSTLGFVEQILDATRGLAAEGEILTVGRVIRVPRQSATVAEVEVIRLWT